MAKARKNVEQLTTAPECAAKHLTKAELRQQILHELVLESWAPHHIYAIARKHGLPPTEVTQIASEALTLKRELQSLGGIEGLRAQVMDGLWRAHDAAANRRALPRKHGHPGQPWPDSKGMTQALLAIAKLGGILVDRHEVSHTTPLEALSVEQLREIQRTGQLPPGMSLPGFAPRALPEVTSVEGPESDDGPDSDSESPGQE